MHAIDAAVSRHYSRLAMQAQAAYDEADAAQIALDERIADEFALIESSAGLSLLRRVLDDIEGREALIEWMERFA